MKRDVGPLQSGLREIQSESLSLRLPKTLQDKTIEWMFEHSVVFETNRLGIVAAAWKNNNNLVPEDTDDLIGRSLPEYFADLGGHEFAPIFRNAVREKQDTQCEMQVIIGNRHRWLRARTRPFVKGRQTCVSVIVEDIQDIKYLEEALDRQRTLFDLVEEATETGSWEYDIESGLVCGSKRFRLMAGLAGTPISAPVHYTELLRALAPEFRDAAVGRMKKTEETGKISECEAEYLTPSGRRALQCRAVPLMDAGGKVTRIVGSVRDITDWKRREGELERQRLFSSQAMLLAKIGAWEWNRETGELEWSPEMYRALGLDPISGGMTSDKFEKMRQFPDRGIVERENAGAFARGSSIERISKLLLPDGTLHVIRTRATTACDASGKRVIMRGVSQDITEQMEAEERLRENKEMLQKLSAQLIQTSDEERRRIARTLHETVAQSMAALKMTLSKLHKRLREEGNPAQDLAQASHDLSGQALRELRTISHLMHPPLLELAGLAAALQSYADGFSRRSGIDVSLEAEEKLHRLDPETETTLFRIVQEALTNVHRHSESSRAVVRLKFDEKHLHLEIEDFGRGMDLKIPVNDKRSVHDMGVGLAGIRERVRLLDGEFQVVSELGEGTLLRAKLPLKRPSGELQIALRRGGNSTEL